MVSLVYFSFIHLGPNQVPKQWLRVDTRLPNQLLRRLHYDPMTCDRITHDDNDDDGDGSICAQAGHFGPAMHRSPSVLVVTDRTVAWTR